MAQADLHKAAFTDENAAREAIGAVRWPNGPVCPHCGNLDQSKIARSQGKAARPGLYYCAACNGQFTVTVGTVMERSKIPLTKWLLAMYLMGASKKGMSALQLQRMLGVTYKTAWFLCHRIREAMTNSSGHGPLGGEGKIVEADETYIGGKEKNKHRSKKLKSGRGNVGKMPVLSLVERGGAARSFHVANVTGATLRPLLTKHVNAKMRLVTDESGVYLHTGKEFAAHAKVNHTAGEYVKDNYVDHTNTIESVFRPDEARRVRNASLNQRSPPFALSRGMGLQVEHSEDQGRRTCRANRQGHRRQASHVPAC